jgi:hypothetical protein
VLGTAAKAAFALFGLNAALMEEAICQAPRSIIARLH